MHVSHRYYTMSYVNYDVVCAYRLKHTIYAYDVYILYRLQYRKEQHLTWSRCHRCGSHWPGPCRPHCPSLLILGPAGWSVLRCDSPDTLSLVLAYEAAPGPDSSCPSQTGQSQPQAADSGAVGALAVRQCLHNVIRDISTDCVSQ
jgi:hypothetical protein